MKKAASSLLLLGSLGVSACAVGSGGTQAGSVQSLPGSSVPTPAASTPSPAPVPVTTPVVPVVQITPPLVRSELMQSTQSFKNTPFILLAETYVTNSNSVQPLLHATDGNVISQTSQLSLNDTDPNDNSLEVTLDGVAMSLVGRADASGKRIYEIDQNGMSTSIFGLDGLSSVVLTAFQQSSDVVRDDVFGFVASGTRTDPSLIPAFAFYSGTSYLTAVREDGAADTATGDIQVLADYGGGVFEGTMYLVSPNDPTKALDLGDVSLSFTDGVFVGDTMTATIEVQANSLGSSNQLGMGVENVISSALTGNFFGANGEEIGGHFTITGDTSSPIAPMAVVVNGGFIAQEQ